jgi:HAD superfamily hydrolase (TIGR01509 family)
LIPTVRHWLFDLDGTLTVAQHDFAGIKRRLGLPPDLAILEAIALRPASEQAELLERVHAWEAELADSARAAPGAAALLGRLRDEGRRLGVVTRNSRATALRTLAAAGLRAFLSDEDVVGRDEAAPKPAPDGLRLLLARWNADPGDAVMVGDFRFDLEAARAAGVSAIWVDLEGDGRFDALAWRVIRSLEELA